MHIFRTTVAPTYRYCLFYLVFIYCVLMTKIQRNTLRRILYLSQSKILCQHTSRGKRRLLIRHLHLFGSGRIAPADRNYTAKISQAHAVFGQFRKNTIKL